VVEASQPVQAPTAFDREVGRYMYDPQNSMREVADFIAAAIVEIGRDY
jgi:hypothetical protein